MFRFPQFLRGRIALLSAVSAAALAFALAASPPEAVAGPPHGGPHFDHRHRPPPPHYRYHRHHRHDRWYNDWGFWGPALTIGAVVVGSELLRDSRRDARRTRADLDLDAPQTAAATSRAAPAPSGGHAWYWCSSEQAYYPTVLSCPLGWETVMGSSATEPPAPPED